MNPMVYVKKVKHRVKNRTWTKDEVEKFIDTAFSRWEWRNIGILVLLCYEYAQRPIDIARLKWENVDFDTDTITEWNEGQGVAFELKGMNEPLTGYGKVQLESEDSGNSTRIFSELGCWSTTNCSWLVPDFIEQPGNTSSLPAGRTRSSISIISW